MKTSLRFDPSYNNSVAVSGPPNSFSADAIESLADRIVGLHASRPRSPAMALVGRARKVDWPTPYYLGIATKSLVRVPAMRGTIHLMPIKLAGIAHSATKQMRISRTLYGLKRHGISADVAIAAAQRLADAVGHSPVEARELSGAAEGFIGPTGAAPQSSKQLGRRIVRLAWDFGSILAFDNSATWSAEHRHFVNAETVDWSPPEMYIALDMLLDRYVRHYGPVSKRDIDWWTGFRVPPELPALQRLYHAASGYYSTVEAIARISGNHDPQTKVRFQFLGYEDPFLKAYFDTRHRYASQSLLDRVFHSTGEAKAAILRNGRVCGTWSWNINGSVEHELLCALPNDEVKLVEARLGLIEQKLSRS